MKKNPPNKKTDNILHCHCRKVINGTSIPRKKKKTVRTRADVSYAVVRDAEREERERNTYNI